MRLFQKAPDGGKKSGVDAFFLIEWKPVCSVAILRFSNGSREAFHSHAFNAVTWWLKGRVREERLLPDGGTVIRRYTPSLLPKITTRNNTHKVISYGVTWALTIRGPWEKTWREVSCGVTRTFTHGRKVVEVSK